MSRSVRDVKARVSSDGVVVNGGARQRAGNQTTLALQAMNHRRRLMILFQFILFEHTTEDNITLELSWSFIAATSEALCVSLS